MTTQEKLTNLFAKIDMAQLIEAFEATDKSNAPETPVIREWIMNEMERRNPQAFESWLEGCATIPARNYFLEVA